jgi:transposase-like protein
MAKRKASRKRISAADRTRILAEAKVNNWTAEQIAKRFGVSKWTVYGWRKRRGGEAGRPAQGRRASVRGGGPLHEEFRSLLSEIVREEIARVLTRLSEKSRTRRGA